MRPSFNLLYGNQVPLSRQEHSQFALNKDKQTRACSRQAHTYPNNPIIVEEDGTSQASGFRLRSVFHVGMVRCSSSDPRLQTPRLRSWTPR